MLDVHAVRVVHAIFYSLKNSDLIAQQIATESILLLKKDRESIAKSIYCLNDGPLDFPLCNNLFALSAFCDWEC